MKSEHARVRTQAGLDLLAHALRGLDVAESAIERIGFGAGGRPEISGAPGFSISHSDRLVACAVDDDTRDSRPGEHRLVGLDVEARRPIVPARLARLMSPGQAAIVEDEPDRFFDFWCAREATVKASGRVGLARIRSLDLHGDHARLDAHDWPLQPLDLVPGYAACIASDRPIGPVRSERITLTG
ncbi:4'-phosphopantetheinyl transferase family protein [Salinisphaera aquimarina]|uniref:4'-phosphopantetheinyl transferase family protein n=1 Tax=Salinisphaera aquimarina TaxID=2094031 RepID=A0ABV7EW91_9GAMM